MTLQPVLDSLDKLTLVVTSLREGLAEPNRSDIVRSGIIKNFEFVYELSWKTIKRLLEYWGITTGGPRDNLGKAFQEGLIQNESVWLEILSDRNLTVHTYDKKLAREVSDRIAQNYMAEFEFLLQSLTKQVHSMKMPGSQP